MDSRIKIGKAFIILTFIITYVGCIIIALGFWELIVVASTIIKLKFKKNSNKVLD